jgi:hypothetical protein
MAPVERIVKADQAGRLNLGRKLAGRSYRVVEHGTSFVLEHVETVHVPAEEAWLYRNTQALASVQRGLQQIAAGEFANGPDLNVAHKLAATVFPDAEGPDDETDAE